MDEFHGWQLTGARWSLHIGYLPMRKQPAIYVQDDERAVIASLGYFTSEANAQAAMERLDMLIPSRPRPTTPRRSRSERAEVE